MGAESFAGFIERIDSAIARVQQSYGGPVALFAHGYVIHAVEMRLATIGEAVDAGLMNRFISTWPTNAPDHCEGRAKWIPV